MRSNAIAAERSKRYDSVTLPGGARAEPTQRHAGNGHPRHHQLPMHFLQSYSPNGTRRGTECQRITSNSHHVDRYGGLTHIADMNGSKPLTTGSCENDFDARAAKQSSTRSRTTSPNWQPNGRQPIPSPPGRYRQLARRGSHPSGAARRTPTTTRAGTLRETSSAVRFARFLVAGRAGSCRRPWSEWPQPSSRSGTWTSQSIAGHRHLSLSSTTVPSGTRTSTTSTRGSPRPSLS